MLETSVDYLRVAWIGGDSALNNKALVKRSSEHLKGFQRKQRNASDFEYGLSHQSKIDNLQS